MLALMDRGFDAGEFLGEVAATTGVSICPPQAMSQPFGRVGWATVANQVVAAASWMMATLGPRLSAGSCTAMLLALRVLRQEP